MRERPILMSAPMVRALLAGTKTQTRRIVKITHRTPGLAACLDPADPSWVRRHTAAELCPYGIVGERLWVRETCALNSHGERAYYRADCHQRRKDWILPMGEGAEICIGRWTPAIHMPRWASRITLEITEVRVERLQEISEADALAEGIEPVGDRWRDYDSAPRPDGFADPRKSYRSLWHSINGPGSWDLNLWVWALTFRRIGDA